MSKTITGIVTSAKADKTIVISAQTRKTHPLYRKQYTVTSKYMAHDEKNSAQVGDNVTIVECRPISANKRFKLLEINLRAKIEQDKLAAVKVEDSGHVESKSKAKVEDTSEKEKAD